ncbi:MAG: 13E12 repeat family protein, partial [Actinomycetota bacterium]|nr:13E12 repeat family protein [Actinomycetota bacterium]
MIEHTFDKLFGGIVTTLIGDHGVVLWALTDEQLTAEVESALRARASLDEWCTRLVGAAEERDLARLAGATSTAVWLRNLTGISRHEAKRIIDPARAMGELVEDTRKAWAAGQVTTEQATIICTAINALPDWVGDAERLIAQERLLESAKTFTNDDLKRIANHILEVIDPDGVDEHLGKQLASEEQTAHDKTELTMYSAGNGMTRGRFLIPTVQAGMLTTVLEGLASPRRNDPAIYDRDGEHSDAATGTLTHAQKLGRAFCELLEHLPSEAMPQHGGL